MKSQITLIRVLEYLGLIITEDSQLQWNQSKQVQIAKYNHYAIIGIAIHILVLILFASGFQKNSECMTCNSTI